MISDILNGASYAIQKYLDDPAYENTYTGHIRDEIEALLVLMERALRDLDARL